jgi:hypothetical protein
LQHGRLLTKYLCYHCSVVVKWWWLGSFCTRPVVSWIIIELAHRNNRSMVDMLLYSDTLSRFRTKQSLILLCVITEAVNTNFIIFGLTQPVLGPTILTQPVLGPTILTQPVLGPTIYRTPGEHANHYTNDEVEQCFRLYNECHKLTKLLTIFLKQFFQLWFQSVLLLIF